MNKENMASRLPLKLIGCDTNPAEVQRVSRSSDGLIVCEGLRVQKATEATEWNPRKLVAGCYRWRDMQGPTWHYGMIDAKGNIEHIETQERAFARLGAR